VNIPLNDVAALRIAGQINQRDGYTTNVLSGDKYDEVDNQAFRVQLLLKPTRDVTNNTLVSYLDEDATPASSALYGGFTAFPGATSTTTPVEHPAGNRFTQDVQPLVKRDYRHRHRRFLRSDVRPTEICAAVPIRLE
jgi:hypothetical protein